MCFWSTGQSYDWFLGIVSAAAKAIIKNVKIIISIHFHGHDLIDCNFVYLYKVQLKTRVGSTKDRLRQ